MASVCHSLLSVPSMRVTAARVCLGLVKGGGVFILLWVLFDFAECIPHVCSNSSVPLNFQWRQCQLRESAFSYILPDVETQEWGGENNTLKLSFCMINVVSKYAAVIDLCSVALVCKHNRDTHCLLLFCLHTRNCIYIYVPIHQPSSPVNNHFFLFL